MEEKAGLLDFEYMHAEATKATTVATSWCICQRCIFIVGDKKKCLFLDGRRSISNTEGMNCAEKDDGSATDEPRAHFLGSIHCAHE